MNFLRSFVDERFLTHRRQSTSMAGITCALMALGLFEYRLIVWGTWQWDLLIVAGTFVVIKLSLMLWYSLTH